MSLLYIGKHRAPRARAPKPARLVLDLGRMLDTYERTYAMHRRDRRSSADAMALALIDADDALTAWAVSVP